MFKTITATAKKIFNSTPETEVQKGPEAGSFEYFLEMAERAWPLTEEALSSSGIPEVADRCHGRKKASFRQSPLHKISNAWHTSIPLAVRMRLRNSADFKQCVAHVFSRVSRESVKTWADAKRGHGYYEPMVDTCLWALEEGLVALPPEFVWEETEVYPKYPV